MQSHEYLEEGKCGVERRGFARILEKLTRGGFGAESCSVGEMHSAIYFLVCWGLAFVTLSASVVLLSLLW